MRPIALSLAIACLFATSPAWGVRKIQFFIPAGTSTVLINISNPSNVEQPVKITFEAKGTSILSSFPNDTSVGPGFTNGRFDCQIPGPTNNGSGGYFRKCSTKTAYQKVPPNSMMAWGMVILNCTAENGIGASPLGGNFCASYTQLEISGVNVEISVDSDRGYVTGWYNIMNGSMGNVMFPILAGHAFYTDFILTCTVNAGSG